MKKSSLLALFLLSIPTASIASDSILSYAQKASNSNPAPPETRSNPAFDSTTNGSDTVVTFINNGGYSGYMTVTYWSKDRRYSYSTGTVYAGQKRHIIVPGNARNLVAEGYAYSGIMWAPTKLIFNQAICGNNNKWLKYGNGNAVDYRVTGTTFSPRWSTPQPEGSTYNPKANPSIPCGFI